jgi:hypothetical protein
MSQSLNNRAMAVPRIWRVYCPNCYILANWNRATTQKNLQHVLYKCPYFSISVPCFSFASRLSVRLCSQSCVLGRRLPVLPMEGHDGTDATPINHIVPSSSTAVQVVPEVVVLRDRMNMIVDHLK